MRVTTQESDGGVLEAIGDFWPLEAIGVFGGGFLSLHQFKKNTHF